MLVERDGNGRYVQSEITTICCQSDVNVLPKTLMHVHDLFGLFAGFWTKAA